MTEIVGTDVIVDWPEPDNNFSSITAYEIVFEDVNGDY